MVTATWLKTNQGSSLYLETEGLRAVFPSSDLDKPAYIVRTATVSFWEGLAGHEPARWFDRWRYNRGKGRLRQQIRKALHSAMKERREA